MAAGISVAGGAIQVEGVESLIGQLRNKEAWGRTDLTGNLRVGYLAPYSVYVHERTDIYHEQGEAKYLEKPARLLRKVLRDMVVKMLAAGKTMRQALTFAGWRLLRESQKLVPIDTGYLHDSGYVRVE